MASFGILQICSVEAHKVENLYKNALMSPFPLISHKFIRAPFPYKNIYVNGVPAPLHPDRDTYQWLPDSISSYKQHNDPVQSGNGLAEMTTNK